MSFLTVLASGDGATSVLDPAVITTVINAVKEFVGILMTPPLGVFLTIGILGTIVGVVASVVNVVK